MGNNGYALSRLPGQLARVDRKPGTRRLIVWLILVFVLAGLSFAANAVSQRVSHRSTGIFVPAGSDQSGSGLPSGFYIGDPNQPPQPGYVERAPVDDSFYSYLDGIGGFVQYGILLGLVLLIARGLPRRETFALCRPKSWPGTLGLVLGVLAATFVASSIVAALLGPAGDTHQGIPEFWDGSRTAQFALNFLVVAAVAPIVEELMFRGLGYHLLSRYGARAALLLTAVLFGLMHGYLLALPLFVIAGLAFGWLRMRTGSVYPGMVMHGLFNATMLIAAVTLG